jgi:ABC-type polysaccharide/polyol phosphate export permease
VLSGVALFGCFLESTSGALNAMVARANLIRKVYVPKYIFPLAYTINGFITLLFSLAALLLVMLSIGAPFRVSMLAAPVVIAYMFVFCLGTGLLLATSFVFFRDTAHIYSVVITALNYMSAIFFDVAIVPEKYMPIIALNPMYHYIRVFRQSMLYGVWPGLADHLICGGIAIIALCGGIFVFYRNQDKFILYI